MKGLPAEPDAANGVDPNPPAGAVVGGFEALVEAPKVVPKADFLGASGRGTWDACVCGGASSDVKGRGSMEGTRELSVSITSREGEDTPELALLFLNPPKEVATLTFALLAPDRGGAGPKPLEAPNPSILV